MVTLETAEKALKSVYLNVVADQLNVGVNPLLAKIEQTSADVWGKEIIKLVPYGLNGGIGGVPKREVCRLPRRIIMTDLSWNSKTFTER